MQNYQQPLQPTYTAQNGYRSTMPMTQQTVQAAPMSYQSYTPPQMTQTPSYIPGRCVPNEESIIPNEVPMDGNYGIFVQNDLQRIYAKTWGNDGRIHTNRYVLETAESSTNQSDQNDVLNQILNRLDNIEKKIRYQPKPNLKYNKSNTKKQEVTEHE